ncbi:DNA gyrase inhibitor YacG [Poriferisphaera sp. WC338]|uniref:DNA gyrase inhibitor YacG n=1 Tax=Poriferisphaera sp. WC338 TaxID=3425129 RepID=UPI003D814279
MSDKKNNRQKQHGLTRKCPVCEKQTEEANRSFPFCSERCRTIDLAKWRDESYVISRSIEESDLDEGE